MNGFDLGLFRNGQRSKSAGVADSSWKSMRDCPTGNSSFNYTNPISNFTEHNFILIKNSQSRNRYVNYVVIQQNPVIMQDSDDTIRVECAFEASEQTVSFSSGSRGNGLDGLGAGSLDVTSVPHHPITYEYMTIHFLYLEHLSVNWVTTW